MRPHASLRPCLAAGLVQLGTGAARRTFVTHQAAPMDLDFKYQCSIDAEPLHRYAQGGYHPVHLGDVLHAGRFRIVHKLGWGGHSTVWAAKDNRTHGYVAVKIATADQPRESSEVQILRAVASIGPQYSGRIQLPSLIDDFQIQGPNGCHICMATELTGHSVADAVEYRRDNRLSGKVVKAIAKQVLWALDCLHQHGIAHGDLHTRNVALAIPEAGLLSDEDFLHRYDKVETGPVTRKDGALLECRGLPNYLVFPAACRPDLSHGSPPIKLIDFGEAFLATHPPTSLRTPLAIRPPEAIFGDRLDHKVDMWSMGCLLFELVTGQPPFESHFATKKSVVDDMLASTGEILPDRWLSAYESLPLGAFEGESSPSLQPWLEQIYFDEDKEADFTQEDITKIGDLVLKMLRLEPSKRMSARQVLEDPWFNGE